MANAKTKQKQLETSEELVQRPEKVIDTQSLASIGRILKGQPFNISTEYKIHPSLVKVIKEYVSADEVDALSKQTNLIPAMSDYLLIQSIAPHFTISCISSFGLQYLAQVAQLVYDDAAFKIASDTMAIPNIDDELTFVYLVDGYEKSFSIDARYVIKVEAVTKVETVAETEAADN